MDSPRKILFQSCKLVIKSHNKLRRQQVQVPCQQKTLERKSVTKMAVLQEITNARKQHRSQILLKSTRVRLINVFLGVTVKARLSSVHSQGRETFEILGVLHENQSYLLIDYQNCCRYSFFLPVSKSNNCTYSDQLKPVCRSSIEISFSAWSTQSFRRP